MRSISDCSASWLECAHILANRHADICGWCITWHPSVSRGRPSVSVAHYMQNTSKHQLLMWHLRAHQTDNTQVFQSIGCHRKCSLQWLGRSSLTLLPILMIENSHDNNISQTANRQLMPSPVKAHKMSCSTAEMQPGVTRCCVCSK